MGWLATLWRWLVGADQTPLVLDLGDIEPRPLQISTPVDLIATKKIVSISLRSRRIAGAFDAAHPVRTRAGLFGRNAELDQLLEAVLNYNKHAVIYGARGSGKTSLARILGDYADDAGSIVIYNACEPKTSFAALVRPYLQGLPAAAFSSGARAGFLASLARLPEDFSPRALVELVAGRVVSPTIFIFDEFDRVEDVDVLADFAAAMKLLADALVPMMFVLVGIARTVSDVIGGHASLRRHMQIVALGRIANGDVAALIDSGEAGTGIRFSLEARDIIADAGCGSPYHIRLFAGKAALAAVVDNESLVTGRHVHQGFVDAFAEWSSINESNSRLFATALISSTPTERAAIEELARGIAAKDVVVLAPHLMSAGDALDLALVREPEPGGSVWVHFQDTTAAQMLVALIMAEQAPSSSPTRGGPRENIGADDR